ncbi:hypothetical protein CRYUN_Cryun20dG0074600 [Craigia yunnanensis]
MGVVDQSGITIGEVLEATTISVGDKLVDQGDAAVIRAAEARAVGHNVLQPIGLDAIAQATATYNACVAYDYNKITKSDVLSLPRDKAMTRKDADGMRGAELSNKPDMMTPTGGVVDTMATTVRVIRNDTP